MEFRLQPKPMLSLGPMACNCPSSSLNTTQHEAVCAHMMWEGFLLFFVLPTTTLCLFSSKNRPSPPTILWEARCLYVLHPKLFWLFPHSTCSPDSWLVFCYCQCSGILPFLNCARFFQITSPWNYLTLLSLPIKASAQIWKIIMSCFHCISLNPTHASCFVKGHEALSFIPTLKFINISFAQFSYCVHLFTYFI